MPRSRRRHHSRSRSRSRSHSHERDREPKRRKIESYDSPHHRRSVSSEPESRSENVFEQALPIMNEQLEASAATSKIDVTEVIDVTESGDEQNYKTEIEPISETTTGAAHLGHSAKETDADASSSYIAIDSDEDDVPKSDFLKKGSDLLMVTPKKIMSPRQIQKRLESEKKRAEKQKERELEKLRLKQEKEKQRLEKEEQRMKEKLEKQEQKQKELELKQKEKEMKEEQKRKEREEKEMRRKEKEEKEEQKRKEKEQEKMKRQLEIDEKNKEKQKVEEKKQKAAAVFANFFVAKKSDSVEEKKQEDSIFMPFEVKSDMRLAPTIRRALYEEDKDHLTLNLQQQSADKLYTDDLKIGKKTGKCERTWPFDDPDDVLFVEENDLGESIVEQKPKTQKMRSKYLYFRENQRPPYFGTWRKKSSLISARRPFSQDPDLFNYEVNSDDDWEEEDPGESLLGSDDEDKDNDSGNEYEVDNEFFVPHGHLSEDEMDEEVTVQFSPESHKAKLKLLKNEFDEEMKCKTQKIKPRLIGCIWYNKAQTIAEEAIHRYLQPLSIMCGDAHIVIKKRSDPSFRTGGRKSKSRSELSKEHVPMFLKLIHGNKNKRKMLVSEFQAYLLDKDVNVTKGGLGRQLKQFAQWKKIPEGQGKGKTCWYVNEEVRKEYHVDLTFPNQWKYVTNQPSLHVSQ